MSGDRPEIRSSLRYVPRPDLFREQLRQRIIALAKEYGRYGYRTVMDLLRREGWDVGKDCVHTMWRHEGLKVPTKQPKRARLWRAMGRAFGCGPPTAITSGSYDFRAGSDARRPSLLRVCWFSHV